MKEQYLLIVLHRILSTVDRRTARLAAEAGLTLSQFSVLEALLSKGDMTVGEVKQAVLSSDGTIPVVVRNLEKEGCLVRKADPSDRRRCILSITPQGRSRVGPVCEKNLAMIRETFSVWTDGEQRALARLLRKFPRD
ncbi:MAG: MarR family transcriptional regulator, 2-MHQ and catechol-resistance regulon repressor [Burkholderia sp.]|jgi:MarR family 2-MHQ and catechol resistance regulon transcriptional repressor